MEVPALSFWMNLTVSCEKNSQRKQIYYITTLRYSLETWFHNQIRLNCILDSSRKYVPLWIAEDVRNKFLFCLASEYF